MLTQSIQDGACNDSDHALKSDGPDLMSKTLETLDPGVLRHNWRQWMDIVEGFARRRRGSGKMDPSAYAALQVELVRICGGLAEKARGADRVRYLQLRDLVRPWLSLQLLAQTDQVILLSVVTQGRQLEREVMGYVSTYSLRRRAYRISLGLGLVAAVAAAWWLMRDTGESVLQRLAKERQFLWHSLTDLSTTQTIILAVAVAGVAALYLLSRGLRS
jgi:hypothetical protein